jgi:hypothetical protein
MDLALETIVRIYRGERYSPEFEAKSQRSMEDRMGIVSYSLGMITSNDGSSLDKQGWIALIDDHPNVRSIPAFYGINPFTNESILFRVPVTNARVVDLEEHIGSIFWFAKEASLVVCAISGKEAQVIKIAESIAHRLHGSFVRT